MDRAPEDAYLEIRLRYNQKKKKTRVKIIPRYLCELFII